MSLIAQAANLRKILDEAKAQQEKAKRQVDIELSKLYAGKAKSLKTATLSELNEAFIQSQKTKKLSKSQDSDSTSEPRRVSEISPPKAVSANSKRCVRTEKVADMDRRLEALLTETPLFTKSETRSENETYPDTRSINRIILGDASLSPLKTVVLKNIGN